MKKLLISLLSTSLITIPVSQIVGCYSYVKRQDFSFDSALFESDVKYQLDEFGIPNIESITNFIKKYKNNLWDFFVDESDKTKANKFGIKSFEVSQTNKEFLTIFLRLSDYYKDQYDLDGHLTIQMTYSLNNTQIKKLDEEFLSAYNKKNFDLSSSKNTIQNEITKDTINILKKVIDEEMYNYMFETLEWKKIFEVFMVDDIKMFDKTTGLNGVNYPYFKNYLKDQYLTSVNMIPNYLQLLSVHNLVDFGAQKILENDAFYHKFDLSSLDFQKINSAIYTPEFLNKDFLNNNDNNDAFNNNNLLSEIYSSLKKSKEEKQFLFYYLKNQNQDFTALAKNEVYYSDKVDGEFKSYNQASQEDLKNFLKGLKKYHSSDDENYILSDIYIKIKPKENNLSYRGTSEPIKVNIDQTEDIN
ncbi:hypothetical protein SHELI_v1c04120 [Spiroplasma helicoides]|uniref:Uncharacterized protein n=1 Tax=Spiroplasma helicoides TaxID=216938 RepID=A0A1B3SKA4_9MOLU|nr:hypothetical protein [Spiroplasma helicoides]AOG60363.1 hypothetical protein SHELI_v1c04120 [Spiroplasma helicoides]